MPDNVPYVLVIIPEDNGDGTVTIGDRTFPTFALDGSDGHPLDSSSFGADGAPGERKGQ